MFGFHGDNFLTVITYDRNGFFDWLIDWILQYTGSYKTIIEVMVNN